VFEEEIDLAVLAAQLGHDPDGLRALAVHPVSALRRPWLLACRSSTRRARAMGLNAFQQQLNPQSMKDDALEARVESYPAMRLPLAKLMEDYPTNGMIRATTSRRHLLLQHLSILKYRRVLSRLEEPDWTRRGFSAERRQLPLRRSEGRLFPSLLIVVIAVGSQRVSRPARLGLAERRATTQCSKCRCRSNGDKNGLFRHVGVSMFRVTNGMVRRQSPSRV